MPEQRATPARSPSRAPSGAAVSGPARRRLALAGAAAALVVVGLAGSRLPGAVGDVVGGALYAALVVVLVASAAPRSRSVVVAGAGFAVCVLVELAQLTGLPAAAVDAVPALAYVLGTTFHAPDLLAYAAGAAGAGAVDALRRRARAPHASAVDRPDAPVPEPAR